MLAAPAPHTAPMTLDDEGFQLTVGFVFARSEYEVVFADLARMEVVTIARRKRDREELVCTGRDGSTQTVPVGDQLGAALPDVLGRARAAGLDVSVSP